MKNRLNRKEFEEIQLIGIKYITEFKRKASE